jgi:NAD(P)-dependent dehydrogenase (short-subunit alcohol dehydrogenase family)
MKGKVCLVTGATSGIGLVTARELARRGASVLIVGRSPERCARALEQIRAETGAGTVEALIADLSSQPEVRKLADAVRQRCPRLDVLVNNAGLLTWNGRRESSDGIEMTWALNHLAPFLLTNLLLPLIKASAPARIVTVASDAHTGTSINFADIQGKQKFSAWRAYAQSKLANILFAYELARALQSSGVTSNALHPGFVRTNFFAARSFLATWVRFAADLFALSPEEGARTSVYLASAPEVATVSGCYFVKERPAESSPQSHDQGAARQLWEVSEEMTRASAVHSGHA